MKWESPTLRWKIKDLGLEGNSCILETYFGPSLEKDVLEPKIKKETLWQDGLYLMGYIVIYLYKLRVKYGLYGLNSLLNLLILDYIIS